MQINDVVECFYVIILIVWFVLDDIIYVGFVFQNDFRIKRIDFFLIGVLYGMRCDVFVK